MTLEIRQATVLGGRVTFSVAVMGSGPAVLYLHPAGGLEFDTFLEDLATRYTVYAPYFPGTAPDAPYEIHHVQTLLDVLLAYEELIDALGLDHPIVIGQSFGGMLAAEIAATFPRIPSALVLLDPVGLWREDLPIANWVTLPLDDLPAILFHDLDSPGARAMTDLPDDPDAVADIVANLTWALGCTGKFAWPIPDNGLDRRLHRISAPTLIVWGEHDALVPVGYATEFATRITGSQVLVIPECGHIPQVERPDVLIPAVREFLDRACTAGSPGR